MAHPFTIELPDAEERIANWQNDQQNIQTALSNQPDLNSLPPLIIQGFTIKFSDMYHFVTRVLAYNSGQTTVDGPITVPPPAPGVQNPINAARFYLGIKNITELPIPPQPSLMSVAVTGFDPIANAAGTNVLNLPVTNETPNATSIFDFSYPCPPTCAPLV